MEFSHCIKSQFGAAIKTLENAIENCPDDLWGSNISENEFWYRVYHTIFWLDLYLTASPDSFRPPEPFTMSERDPAGILPDTIYTTQITQ